MNPHQSRVKPLEGTSKDVNPNVGARMHTYAFMGKSDVRQSGMSGNQAPNTKVNVSERVSYPPNPNAPSTVSENPQPLLRGFFRRENADQSCNNPSAVLPYSDQLACALTEKLAAEETFEQAAFVLITWLERGDCNNENCTFFYSMVQSTNTNVCRLQMGKFSSCEELNKAKCMKDRYMQFLLLRFDEICKVFNAASLQQAWDNFTEKQKKNIRMWKKQAEEIKDAHAKEVSNDEDEVRSNDGSSKDGSIDTVESESVLQEVSKIQDETDSLKCQLEDSQAEVQRLREKIEQEKQERDQQMQELRQNMQRELTRNSARNEAELRDLRLYKRMTNGNNRVLGESSRAGDPVTSTSDVLTSVTSKESRLISLMSSFLKLHPFGASLDYICSYLQDFDNTVEARDVEIALKKFPAAFRENSTGVGASLKKTWHFIVYNSAV